jgi:hypothetical protein
MRYLGRRKRKKLTRAAGGKQGRDRIAQQPVAMGAIVILGKLAIRVEMRDRKGQQPASYFLRQFTWRHAAHAFPRSFLF